MSTSVPVNLRLQIPMIHSSAQAEIFLDRVRGILAEDIAPTTKLMHVWLRLAFMHNSFLADKLRSALNEKVYSGPFKGMRLTPEVMINAFAPVLLGTYEHELHDIVERIIKTPYQNILNIGCGYGYYSVGLALRMPSIHIHGFDIAEGEQSRCRGMAALNNVQDRMTIAGRFDGEQFASYADQKTLVIMDIEGGEMDLLDPVKYPALQKMDVLVELHDVFALHISKTICARFEATHTIEIIRNRPLLFDFTPLVGPDLYIDPFDQLIVTWENRGGPTPWAFMRAKS